MSKCNPGEFLSTNDLVNAIIWRAVVRARHQTKEMVDDGSTPTQLVMMCDIRKRIQPVIDNSFLGSTILFTLCKYDRFPELLHASLASVALEIRHSLNHYMQEARIR